MRHGATGNVSVIQVAVKKKLVRVLEVPGTQAHAHASVLEVCNQLIQARLRFLFYHCRCFDGADGGLGLLLGGMGEGVNVVEDVGGFVDG